MAYAPLIIISSSDPPSTRASAALLTRIAEIEIEIEIEHLLPHAIEGHIREPFSRGALRNL